MAPKRLRLLWPVNATRSLGADESHVRMQGIRDRAICKRELQSRGWASTAQLNRALSVLALQLLLGRSDAS